MRDYDGKTRSIERWNKTKAAAERSLELALRDQTRPESDGDVTAETRVSTLAETWYAGLKDLSPITMQAYCDRLDAWPTNWATPTPP